VRGKKERGRGSKGSELARERVGRAVEWTEEAVWRKAMVKR
jgi:hypothetical protein